MSKDNLTMSDDLVSRQEVLSLAKIIHVKEVGFRHRSIDPDDVRSLPSRGAVMDDRSVCEYILERIREYIDEYSDTDVNGYHNSKWCAMKKAEAVVLEAMDNI